MEGGIENEGSLTCVFLCPLILLPPLLLWGLLPRDMAPRVHGFLEGIGLFGSSVTTR